MEIFQGTTPYLLWRLTHVNLGTARRILLTIRQHGKTFDFWDGRNVILQADDSGTLLAIHLTQQETLELQPGKCTVQPTWVDADRQVHKTRPRDIEHLESLYKEVIDVD